jgi:hypothetical protein
MGVKVHGGGFIIDRFRIDRVDNIGLEVRFIKRGLSLEAQTSGILG